MQTFLLAQMLRDRTEVAMSWRLACSQSIAFLLVHLAQPGLLSNPSHFIFIRETCGKTLDRSSLKHKGNLEKIFAVQGIAGCQPSLSIPPGLSLWSHSLADRVHHGKKRRQITGFLWCPTARRTQGRTSCTCADRKCLHHSAFTKLECNLVSAIKASTAVWMLFCEEDST